ncbi:MAG: hypothetical protein DRI94_05695 [Bacteroidetes bacterium]|nr:MAG: hypothetical protein DRI94_05695 [Bacteroidota bacterium]
MFFPFDGNCQNDTINQTDTSGNNFGYWRYIYENDTIKSHGHFKIIKEPYNEEELFMRGIYTNNSDSVYGKIKSYKDGKWESFDKHGRLIEKKYFINGFTSTKTEFDYNTKGRLIKTVKNGRQTFYGTKQDLLIDNLSFTISGQINDTYQSKIILVSNSDKEIKLHFKTKSDRVKILKTDYLLKPKLPTDFIFINTIKEGGYTDKIELEFITLDTNRVDIIVNSFGYHISSNNFRTKNNDLKTFRLKGDTLVLIRKYNSCEMKIYEDDGKIDFNSIEASKKEVLKTIPLSFERNFIDLSKIKKGNYLLRIIDYKNGINLYAKLEKE